MTEVPRWTRWLLRGGAVITATERAAAALRDETVMAWTQPSQRAAVTAWVYDHQPGYVTATGLHDWERAIVATFPPGGRVLVGGAGGGREGVALRALGFEVIGFDPSPSLVRAAQLNHGLSLVEASYADVVRAVRERRGPLVNAFATTRFEAMVLGWGSLSHVTVADERRDLFSALRALAPRAPVLASFHLRERGPPAGRMDTWRAALRRGFARLGAPGLRAPGVAFLPWAGFVHAFTWGEIETLAVQTGYVIARCETEPYPHALFVPAA